MIKHKYVEIATRKVVSSYGGVGSLFETMEGSIIIEPFDEWDYTKRCINKYISENDLDNIENCSVQDERLLARLQFQFSRLKYLFRIPSNISNSNFIVDPEDKERVINARYFPQWFYCSRCNSFKHISQWKEEWKKALNGRSYEEIDESFQTPKCAECYLKYKNKNKGKNSSNLHKNSKFDLEQVRFIMTAPNGEIRDLPWDCWVTAKKDSDASGQLILDFDHKCCDNPDLEYRKSSTFEDYTGVRIKCRSCGKENTLSGLFGLRIKVPNTENIFYKPVLRTSNSVYYPIIFNSLYIPTKSEEISHKKLIKDLSEINKTPEEIASILTIDIAVVKKVLGVDSKPDFENEDQYRLKEYNYIISSDCLDQDEQFVIESSPIEKLKDYFISNLTQIKRLKMTSVQTGYTRQEPYDKDEFLKEESSKKAMYTSSDKNMTKILPAIESYGEGIFFKLDDAAIEEWYSAYNTDILKRVNLIKQNIKSADCKNSKHFEDDFHFAKFLLIHTLSHILIKELEFLCGYPATSISERLYVDSKSMHGVLIYTIAGTEGSYGGLVSHGASDKFSKLLISALIRACDCASDPVCYNSDGQGVNGQNLAACYNCVLLPETSCEQFNSYLDRALLIDETFGFFRSIVC